MIVAAGRPGTEVQFEPGLPAAKDERGRTTRIAQRGKVIRFQPYHQKERGIPCNVPGVRRHPAWPNELRSRIETEVVAPQLGVSVEELDEFLLNHRNYGKDFIRIDKNTEVFGDEDGLGDGIVAVGDNEAHCMLCDQHFMDKRGALGHTMSKAHHEALEAKRQELLEAGAV